jgi:Protein of unknown function (DUF4012)
VKHRLRTILLVTIAVLAALTIYVRARVKPEVHEANRILSGNVTDLSSREITAAERHLQTARDVLYSLPADLLRLIPIERQNLDAVRAGVRKTLPVLSSARSLRAQLNAIQTTGIVHSGRLSLEAIGRLQPLLADASKAISSLVTTLKNDRSGWLLPGIWKGLTKALTRAEQAEGAVATISKMARLAPQLLGASEPRQYLVLLVNNAEVRPSGGIVSGIGLVRVSQGRVRLGAFHYYTDFVQKPYVRVPAPPDFRRRYGRFQADTTHWVNTTMSPDTEEVAAVAARLYKRTAGISTDGAIVADPRGIASLLPPGIHVGVPGTDTKLAPGGIARYIYSTAYAQLGANTPARHGALIDLGRSAFRKLLSVADFGSKAEIKKAATAVGGGHLRVISFRPDEEQVLRGAGVTGALRSTTRDQVFVTDTNFNGTKLDYWTRKTVSHACDLRADALTPCETTVTVRNAVPQGLSSYVAGDRPYGLLRNLVEVYIPTGAVLQRVLLDHQSVEFSKQREDGLISIGVPVAVPPGQESHIQVNYALPPSHEGYSLQISPQPLAHDPHFLLTLRMPPGWTVSGNRYGKLVSSGRVFEQTGQLAGPQTIRATPVQLEGIPALWQNILDFWHNPIF